jgi:aldose 1-epimerase
MSISKKNFGKTTDGIEIDLFTLENLNGMKATITNYGGIVVSLTAADKNGKFDDVVLGYDTIEDYFKGNKFFGALIGRCGNRIENSTFKINNTEYNVTKNEGENHLHGGLKGFDKVVWGAKIIDADDDTLQLSYLSKDGEEGYPGNLNVIVTYTLTSDNALSIKYSATGDKDTIVNLTNHSYFNLSGHSSGDILNHKLMINSDKFTVNDKYSIPTGELQEVGSTPMNFKTLTTVGENIDSDYEQIQFGAGYDHNWMLNSNGNLNEKVAQLVDEASGRVMDVYTTKPAVQLYSSNFLDGSDIGKGRAKYERRTAICLETQYVPNAVNLKDFNSPILKAGDEYNHTTIYKFSVL